MTTRHRSDGRARARPHAPLSAARAERLRRVLDPFVDRFDAERRIDNDPVALVRRYADPADQEIAGLIASSFAYGQVGVFKPRIERLLDRMGPSPRAFLERFDPRSAAPRFPWFAYRFHGPGDLGALLCGAREIVREAGSLGRFLGEELARLGDLRAALAVFADRLRSVPAPGFPRPRDLDHLLPDPRRKSASKRLLLY